jgi:hypothetical protein
MYCVAPYSLHCFVEIVDIDVVCPLVPWSPGVPVGPRVVQPDPVHTLTARFIDMYSLAFHAMLKHGSLTSYNRAGTLPTPGLTAPRLMTAW